MSSIEQLPLDKLNNVDWESVSEEQAAHFGVVLGDFNESIDEKDTARSHMNHKIFFTLTVAFLVTVSYLMFNVTIAFLVGLCYVTFDVLRLFFKIKSLSLVVNDKLKLLIENIEKLPQL